MVFNLELWKDIKGYEGVYQISNLGNIKSLKRKTHIQNATRIKKEKILKLQLRNGYYVINLCKNGCRKAYSVHRLVAETFIPNPNNLPYINHIDFNTQNNSVDNLEWCTQKDNIGWSRKHYFGRKKVTHSNTGEKYITYRKSTKKFRIIIDKKEYKSCDTLEDAIRFRDGILKEVMENGKVNNSK